MLRRSIVPWATGLILALPQATSQAQDDAGFLPFFDEMPVVLTASRMAQSPLDAPAPVTIIDREMIEASGFTEIHDLLRLVPGFVVADWPDGSPTVANHGIGDAFDRRIKVLIDGRTVNNPVWGDTHWQDLPIRVDDIDHIEVVRGPHGGSYGANAFQGVVNILTRSPLTEEGVTAIARVGVDGFRDAGARINSATGGQVDWRLSASRREADNFKSFKGESAESIQRDVVNFQLVNQLTARDELRLQAGHTEGRDDRGSPTSPTAPLRTDRVRENYLHAAWQRSFDSESELSLQYYHQSRTSRAEWDATAGPVTIPVEMNFDTRRDDLELQLSRRLSPVWHVLWGAGVRHEAVRSWRFFSTRDTLTGTQWQTFGSVTWNPIPELAINAGGVLERHDYSGNLFSPRLAINYALSPLSSLRMSTGIAYRAPSYAESRSRDTVQYRGEAIAVFLYGDGLPVKPEKVRYAEMGYVARFPRAGIDLDTRIFHESYSRYLDDQRCRLTPGHPEECPFPPPANYSPTPITNSAFYFVNSGRFTVRGLEASVNWRKPGWGRIVLSQAFTDIDEESDVLDPDIVRSAPAWTTALLAIKELPARWKLSLGYYHNESMYWLNDGDRVPSRDRFDVKLARGLGAVGSESELALVAQSVGGDYPDFHETKFRHEPRLFASLRLTW